MRGVVLKGYFNSYLGGTLVEQEAPTRIDDR
jgi:hypothetical protein